MMAVRTGNASPVGMELFSLSTKVNGVSGRLGGRGAGNETQTSTPSGLEGGREMVPELLV